MDGGASGSHPFMRRQSNKRNFSTMSASHRENSSEDSLFLPRDDHYDNEHATRRRRFELPHRRTHYTGDGLDFRRPVMSSVATTADHENENSTMNNTAVIDLTDENGAQQQLQGTERQARSTAAPTRSTRAHRLPRFGRDVIEVESSGEDEDDSDISNLPGANYLALPLRRSRPQYSSLRRPARPPSPPTDMEDVEFLEERPRSRPRHESQQSSPAARSRFQRRSATPYPTGVSETIDLTEDNDDDIVHLNTSQREGVNNDRPSATAGVGTRNLADHGFGQIGHIANLLREGGANLGGRLMQRLQGMAGLDGEIRAQQQAYDHFNHNHNRHHVHPVVVRRRQHHNHHHRHRPANGANRAPQAIRILQEMPGMMDYNMTGFDLGVGGGNGPPTPKYSPPPAADKGFTRGPEEDEVVVCPNCGDELAMGDSDIKQEVWVVKSCGHAYCGECAQNRTRTQSKKGKGKAPVFDDPTLPLPFKKCVVEGCGKPTSKSSMIHVYLGC